MPERKSQGKINKNKISKQKHGILFYQFNTAVTPELLYKLADRPLALKVLAVILYCGNELGAVLIKQKYIRQAVAKRSPEANRSSVVSAIHFLRSLGIIAVCRKDVRNAYIINPLFIWRLPTNKKNTRSYILNNKHIHFDASPTSIRQNKEIKDRLMTARKHGTRLYYSDFKNLKPSKPVKSYYRS